MVDKPINHKSQAYAPTIEPNELLYKPCACCGGFTAEANDVNSDFEPIIARLIKQLYKSKDAIAFDADLLKTTAAVFAESMNKAIPETADWTTPDAAMRASLMDNVWHFSSAKNYQQLLDMSQMLYNEKGELNSFAEFKRLALTVDKKYNIDWLQTERNFATNSATMAARWGEYEQTKEANPFLEYQTVGDLNVRESHKALDGIVKDIDDAFWDTYYPPNGWNCRCHAIQLSGKKHSETDTNKHVLPVIDKPFKQNIGKSKVVFPDGHPYYEGIPKEVFKKAVTERIASSRENVREWAKKNIPQGGKTITTKNKDAKSILLKRSDIKSLTGKPNNKAADTYYFVKNIEFILNKANLVKSVIDSGKHATVKMWHYFEFVFDGQKQHINIKEMNDGTLRIHAIMDSIK